MPVAAVNQAKVRITADKNRLEVQLKQITRFKGGATQNTRLLEGAINSAREILQRLEADTNILIINTENTDANPNAVDDAQEEWIDYFVAKDAAIHAGYEALQNLQPVPPDPVQDEARKKIQQVAALKLMRDAKIERITTDLRSFEEKLQAALPDGDGDGELSRLQFETLTKWLGEIKLAIWPGIQELTDRLVDLDLENAETYITAGTAHLKVVGEIYYKQLSSFSAKRIAEDSLAAPGAVATSTPDNSILLGSGVRAQTSTSFSGGDSHRYKYKAEPPPTFSGKAKEYPLWKKEWKNEVCRNKEEAWCIRSIATYIKAEDHTIAARVKSMDKLDDVWDFLDTVFANPTTVSQKVTKEFLAITPRDLKGSNHQQKLVSLELEIRNLMESLRAVDEEGQLQDNIIIISHAIDLLPPLLLDQFTERRHKHKNEVRRDGSKVTARQTYKLLEDFLAEKTLQYREYVPDKLALKTETAKKQIHNIVYENYELDDSSQQEIPVKLNNRDGRMDKKKSPAGGGSAGSQQKSSSGAGRLPRPEWIKKRQAEIGPCPVCKGHHTWINSKKQENPSDQVINCPTFKNMTRDERVNTYKKAKLCRRCLSWGHQVKQCTKDCAKFFCRKDINGTPCGQDHHALLCPGDGSKLDLFQADFLITPGVIPAQPKADVMLAIVEVKIGANVSTCALLDNGSNCSIITHSLAKKLQLKGYWAKQEVELAGKPKEIQDIAYYQASVSMPEGPFSMTLIGLDRITTNPGSFNIEAAYSLFPHIERGLLDKPEGEVQLLIGSDNIRFMPGGGEGVNQVGNLRVFDIPLYPGKVLMGSHPDISFLNPTLAEEIINLRTANITPVHTAELPGPLCAPLCLYSINIPRDFPEAETLGYDVPRKCKRCQQCSSCSIQEEGVTLKEKLELQAIEQNVNYDPVKKKITVSYPIVGDISLFRDNRHQAVTRAEALKKSLKRKNMLNKYNEQVRDFIARGVWKEVSVQVIEEYKAAGGPIHYVAHHGVVNPSPHSSTPLRVVVDSSLKNNYSGPRLSSLYAKGPNQIANLFQCLITWRSWLTAGVYDLSKAYHQMLTTTKEFFMRLVVWFDEVTGEIRTYGHSTVGFGDVTAANMLEVSKKVVAEVGKEIDPMVAQQLVLMSYVDDCLFGAHQQSDIQRMRGNIVAWEKDKPIFDGTITKVLEKASWKAKSILVSGETDPALLDLAGPVLGLPWAPKEDLLTFKLNINISKKVGTGRAEADLTEEDLHKVQQCLFTRRLCLGIASQIWDPTGILTCYTVRLKILVKELVDHEFKWDEVLPEEYQIKWRRLVEEMVTNKPISFPRSLTVERAVGRPELIAFFDGSDMAYGAVVYIRFDLAGTKEKHTRLVTSKSKVTPRGGITTPRSELSGIIVAVRLISNVIKSLSHTHPPRRITIAGDSKCTVSVVDENAASLNPFFANRALEVHGKMKEWGQKSPVSATEELSDSFIADMEDTVVDLVQYIPGKENPADWPTRGNVEWIDMDRGSVWQDGPAFLALDRSEWPLTRDFISDIPVEERRKRFAEASVLNHIWSQDIKLLDVVVINQLQGQKLETRTLSMVESTMTRYNKLTYIRGVVARIARASRFKERHQINSPLTMRDFADAERMMRHVATNDFVAEVKAKSVMESLDISWSEGLPWATGRLSKSAAMRMLGHRALCVISRKTRLAYLVLKHCHEEDHRRSPGDSLFRSVKEGYWILQGRRLADKVVKDCNFCKRARLKTVDQRMGDLPDAVFSVPVRPFTNVCMDFCGAIPVKDEVKRRTKLKTYPMIIVCLNTHAVHIQLVPAYSTEAFLTQLSHYIALRGKPTTIYTDMGSQLASASSKMVEPEVGERPDFFKPKSWNLIRSRTSSSGIEWTHAPPQTQWRDGRSEAVVKALKHTLTHINAGTREFINDDMTYSELSCLLAQAANVINNRPLGLRHHGRGVPDFCVVTPNLLLLGTRTCQAQHHEDNFAKDMANISVRMAMVEKSYHEWWSLWIEQVWHSLVPYRRWRTTERNVRPDDIVLVRYQKKFSKPGWRMARITRVFPDDKGRVRTVEVAARPRHKSDVGKPYIPKDLEIMTVPVQRLVVMVAAEDLDKLPPADDSTHVCDDDDDMRVECPAHIQAPEHVVQDLQHADGGVPLGEAGRLAVNSIKIQDSYSHQCWECDVRQLLLN